MDKTRGFQNLTKIPKHEKLTSLNIFKKPKSFEILNA